MNTDILLDMDKGYIAQTYARFDLHIAEGKGSRCVDGEGKSYIDFTSGIGVNCLGWGNEEWAKAVYGQALKLQHTSNLYYTEPAALLAKELCEKTGMDKVFFANSGAEANEGAIKAARKYSFMKYGENRHKIVTLENSFHGRTMATITATGQDTFHRFFNPFLPGFVYTAANDIDALDKALDGTVCGLMLEIIQGEGGVLPLDEEFIKAAAELCEKRDILLIVDEVQTGIGRTGKVLASQHFDLQPDILSLAKGLGNGLPIGAVLFNEKCSDALAKGDHASTFGANPVCCAGALVVMNKMNDAFLSGVVKKGTKLREALEKMPKVEGVSGMGLMLGIKLKEGIDAREIAKKAIDKGLLCLLAKDKLRLLPPLNIDDTDIEEGLEILKELLS